MKYLKKYYAQICILVSLFVIAVFNLKIGLLFAFVFGLVLYMGLYHSNYCNCDAKCSIQGFSKRLLVVVPHPDDELNIAAVLMRNVDISGGEIYLIYTTNFDVYGEKEAKKRYKELKRVCSSFSIPIKNLIFLGLDATFHSDNKCAHYFNKNYYAKTKSTPSFDSYAKKVYGHEIEINNDIVSGLLKEIILEIKPDIICGIDYDSHIDHRYASLMLDDAIDGILKDSEYRPLYLKGYSYATSWMSYHDFYEDPFFIGKSLFCDNKSSYINKVDRDDEIRISYINRKDLGYTIRSCYISRVYSLYGSQKGKSHRNQVINSDQVLWLQHTDNVLLGSKIIETSGTAENVVSIKTKWTEDIYSDNIDEYPGGWRPQNCRSNRRLVFEKKDQENGTFLTILIECKCHEENIKLLVETEYEICEILIDSLDSGINKVQRKLEFKNNTKKMTFEFDGFCNDYIVKRVYWDKHERIAVQSENEDCFENNISKYNTLFIVWIKHIQKWEQFIDEFVNRIEQVRHNRKRSKYEKKK